MLHPTHRSVEEISGVKGLTMSYSKYEESIVAVHKVAIEGWPVDIPRVSPQSLTKVEDVKDLYDAWSDGQTSWRKLTVKEIREIKGKRDGLEERIKQPKKGRSSGGKQKRTRDEDSDEDENSGRVKKMSKSRSKQKRAREDVTDEERGFC